MGQIDETDGTVTPEAHSLDEAANADCGENKSESLVDRASVGSEKPAHKSFSDWRRRVEWRRGSSLAKNFSGYRLTCNLTVA